MPFVLLVGENGLGPWQALEYAAHDQHVKLLESRVVSRLFIRRVLSQTYRCKLS
jgi:hypothetical protein